MKRIETARLDLWPLLPEDLASMHHIWNNPLVRRYLWDDEPVSVAAARACLEESEREFAESGLGLFGVQLRGETGLIGCCGFRSLEGAEEVELMYSLLPQWWGRGLATEAAHACLRYAFEEVGLERVVAGADAPNAASLRIIEKLGMEPIGNIAPGAPEAPYFALHREDFDRRREPPSNPGVLPETEQDPEPRTHHDETPHPMGSQAGQPERGTRPACSRAERWRTHTDSRAQEERKDLPTRKEPNE
jgi:[ribosomal protein S5]-alanine N-acetyltransferase